MIKKRLSILIGVFFWSLLGMAQEDLPKAAAGEQNDPDLAKEAEFHRIYDRFNKAPTAVELWEKVSGPRKAESYKVLKGDTLSEISNTFFGDPFYWPKVWSLNQDRILNPHELAPGQTIQFYAGSIEAAPLISVGENDPEKNTPEAAEKIAEKAPVDMELPSEKKTVPPMVSLPNSLPEHRVTLKPKLTAMFELGPRKIPQAFEYLSYYLTDRPLVGEGVITGVELDLQTAREHQYIFVHIEGTTSKDYLVQKNLSQVVDPQNKNHSGQLIEVQGEIEILEKVNEEKNIYRAIVKKSLLPIEVGAVLTTGQIPVFNPSSGALTEGLGARVLAGQGDVERKIFSEKSLVFLSAGAAEGLQEGQIFSIYADESLRNKESNALINDRQIGKLKIVKVVSEFATAFLLETKEGVQVGDYVGKKDLQAKSVLQEVEAPKESEEDIELEDSSPGTPEPDSGSEDSDLSL